MTPFYSRHGVTLFHGDNREILPRLEPASVDCIIADPPYGETSLDWDRFTSEWLELVRPLLKPSGSLWCFGSLRMFMEHADAFSDWNLAQDVVWEKHNGSGAAADRFRRVHELALHFYPLEARWADVFKQELREASETKHPTVRERPTHWGDMRKTFRPDRSRDGSRLRRSVIYARSAHGYATNETQKPEAIVEPLVRYSCPMGGVVLSPFAGSGTDLVVAQRLGCKAIGIELRAEQCEAAARRLSQLLPLTERGAA